MTNEEQVNIENLYDKGFIDGLIAFAHWKDGTQEVGTSRTKLSDAIKERKTLWNYAFKGLTNGQM